MPLEPMCLERGSDQPNTMPMLVLIPHVSSLRILVFSLGKMKKSYCTAPKLFDFVQFSLPYYTQTSLTLVLNCPVCKVVNKLHNKKNLWSDSGCAVEEQFDGFGNEKRVSEVLGIDDKYKHLLDQIHGWLQWGWLRQGVWGCPPIIITI